MYLLAANKTCDPLTVSWIDAISALAPSLGLFFLHHLSNFSFRFTCVDIKFAGIIVSNILLFDVDISTSVALTPSYGTTYEHPPKLH